MKQSLLQTVGLSKTYGPTLAAQDINLTIEGGRVHALIGENGAGKSTVIKMITGLVRPTRGHLLWQGQRTDIHMPREAQSRGIVAVHQELTLVDTMTIAQNIWLGHEAYTPIGTIDRRALKLQSSALIESMGLPFQPATLVSKLSLSEKQLVEILKALSYNPRLLILDEATSTLDDKEVKVLHGIVEKLIARECAVIFVSHRMKEIFQFSEYCSVMKDGCVVFEEKTVNVDEHLIITKMTGREMSQGFPPKSGNLSSNANLLSVKSLSTRRGLRDVTFQLRDGEILGIGGLRGHGQVELVECLFGMKTVTDGSMEIGGVRTILRNPGDALRAGIALVPEDRKSEGLFIDRTVEENMIACSFSECTRFGVLSPARVRTLVSTLVEKMDIKSPSVKDSVRRLSGGNQQKVAVGRWLARSFRIFLLIEPTRGIDVGTKFEIYALLRKLANEGVGIIIATNEMIELVGLCDSVLVMFEKRISKELAAVEISEHNILAASFSHGGQERTDENS